MIDFGTVKPGTTLYIPFATYDSNDPTASVTMTGLAVTDIEIYKDGSVTQRASDAGYTLLDTDGTDFDTITGIHGISIDLADNTTAGFYAAGSQYWVVLSSVTVDAGTINGILATFRIGLPDAVLNTTIATLSSQTSFTLTSGPAEDDALNGCVAYIHDVASAVQGGYAVVSDYTGSTKTVTLTAGTTFTAAATDNISIFPPSNTNWIQSTAQTANDNGADINAIKTKTDSLTFTVANQVDANALAISGDTAAADNLELQYDGTGLSGGTYPATQSQLSGIVSVGAAINVASESYALTTGTQSANTYTATAPLDGTRHEHTDTAGALELYYQFDVTTDGTPTQVTMTGYLSSKNDSVGVYAYNWSGTAWEQIGTLAGDDTATNHTETYALYTTHVGTGANLGKVRIRFYAASGLTTATLAIDQLYVSYAVVAVSRQTKGSISDVTPTTTGFDTDLTEATGFWDDALLIFTSGALDGQSRTITTYVNTNGAITFDEATTSAAANGDTFIIYHTHIHPSTQISAQVMADLDANGSAVIDELTTQGDTNEAKIDIIDANVDAVLADTADMQPKLGTPAADISADIAAVKSDSAAILTDTGTTLPAILGTPAGADLATDIAAIKADTAAILIDTNELQGDWTNGGRLDLIIDAILDDTGTSGVVLTAAERNSIADAILDRDMSTGSDSGSTTVRTVRQALRANRNKVTISGGTLTVYKEDDATASWTASVSTTAGDPISDINPAGGS